MRRLLSGIWFFPTLLVIGVAGHSWTSRGARPADPTPEHVAAKTLEDLGGVTADRDGVKSCLASLVPEGAALEELGALIDQLDSDEFVKRREASRQLKKLIVLPPELIRRAKKDPSPEIRHRLGELIKATPEDKSDRLGKAAFQVIAAKRMRGFFPAMVRVLEAKASEPAEEMVLDAALATVLPEDAKLARAAVKSEDSRVHAAGLAGLLGIGGPDGENLIADLLKNGNDDLRYMVAQVLAKNGDIRCVDFFASLLKGEQEFKRMRSAEALKAITGRDFDYTASMLPKIRSETAGKWLAWIAEHRDELKMPANLNLNREMALFNASDLSNWVVIEAGKEVAHKNQTSWAVGKDGILHCTGKVRMGELRTSRLFGDYILKFEWRVTEGFGDGGVGVIASEENPESYLEIQLLPGKTGDLYVIRNFAAFRNGAQIAFSAPMVNGPADKMGEWNRIEIKVSAGTVRVQVNGKDVNQATDCPRKPGSIILRNEGHPMDFRNMTLLPLE